MLVLICAFLAVLVGISLLQLARILHVAPAIKSNIRSNPVRTGSAYSVQVQSDSTDSYQFNLIPTDPTRFVQIRLDSYRFRQIPTGAV